MVTADTSAAFFEGMFAASADPWNFADEPYELARYRHILRAVDPAPYQHALEPGCSVGVLTEQLASVCKRVDAFDIAPTAVALARARCSALPGVSIRVASLRDLLPCTGYDLVVLSEIGYYFHPDEWRALARQLVDSMEPGAVLLLAHWLGSSPDHVLSGDAVHDAIADGRLQHDLNERHTDASHVGFRLDRWRRLP